jgi:hypothetical protein
VPDGNDLGVIPVCRNICFGRISELAGMMLLQRAELAGHDLVAPDCIRLAWRPIKLCLVPQAEIVWPSAKLYQRPISKAHKPKPDQQQDARCCGDEEPPLHNIHGPALAHISPERNPGPQVRCRPYQIRDYSSWAGSESGCEQAPRRPRDRPTDFRLQPSCPQRNSRLCARGATNGGSWPDELQNERTTSAARVGRTPGGRSHGWRAMHAAQR